MSKKSRRPTRREFKQLERQVEQLFEVVTRLVENQRHIMNCASSVPGMVEAALMEKRQVLSALEERSNTAQSFARVDH